MAHLGLGTARTQKPAQPAVGRSKRRGATSSLPKDASSCELFAATVASAIEEKPDMVLAAKGRISVEVPGERGLTVRFGDPKAPLSWGADEAAELRLRATPELLRRLLDGKIDAAGELASGNLALAGDIEMLPPLFRIMERGQSMLSVRMGR